jgi:hypothetical protein
VNFLIDADAGPAAIFAVVQTFWRIPNFEKDLPRIAHASSEEFVMDP